MSAASVDEHPVHDVALDVQAEDVGGAVATPPAASAASLTPPALPRPPVFTWALTTTAADALRPPPAPLRRDARPRRAGRARRASRRGPSPGTRTGPPLVRPVCRKGASGPERGHPWARRRGTVASLDPARGAGRSVPPGAAGCDPDHTRSSQPPRPLARSPPRSPLTPARRCVSSGGSGRR